MDRKTGEGFMLDTRKTTTPLLHVLKAAIAIPVLYNRSVQVDGRHCMDGGMCIPFPIQHALADGCTDLIVLLTHPLGYKCCTSALRRRLMFNAVCGLSQPELTKRSREQTSQRCRPARNRMLGKTVAATLASTFRQYACLTQRGGCIARRPEASSFAKARFAMAARFCGSSAHPARRPGRSIRLCPCEFDFPTPEWKSRTCEWRRKITG